MQDHGSGEAVGGAGFDVGKLCTVNGSDDMRRLIADVATGAPVW